MTAWHSKVGRRGYPETSVNNYLSKLFNPLKAELNPICHLLALLGCATIVVVSRLRVNILEERRPQRGLAFSWPAARSSFSERE